MSQIATKILKGLQMLSVVKLETSDLPCTAKHLGETIIYWEESEEETIIQYTNLSGEFISEYLKKCYNSHKRLDPYGGCSFAHGGQKYKLLNTYGDEDRYPSNIVVCIAVLGETFEALDCKLEKEKLVPRNLWSGQIPAPLKDDSLGVGKRAYYLRRDTQEVSLRVNADTYQRTPEEFRDGGIDEFISSPRVKFKLEKEVVL